MSNVPVISMDGDVISHQYGVRITLHSCLLTADCDQLVKCRVYR
jgi:hypothetical protein